MKKLLLSTALLGGMAFPALAQEPGTFSEAPGTLDIRASDFMGMRLYASEAAVEGEEAAGLQEGWEDIGEINDLILNRDGQVQAVLLDIGGFLGIGERTVAVSLDALRFMSDSATADRADDFFLVINASRAQLEQAPEYSMIMEGEMSAEEAVAETEVAIEEGATDVAAAGEMAAEEVETAVEETGEEVSDAGEEIADEAADAGEEVAEEVDQLDMTDAEEDQAEVADTQVDATDEAAEETAQAQDEAAGESADQAEAMAEGTATETEMEADQTAEAATEEVTATETAETDAATMEGDEAAAGEVVTIVEGDEAVTEEMATDEMAAEDMAADEVSETEMTSAERTPMVVEGFAIAGAEDFTADRLQGAGVYDVNDERVGDVGEILLSEDGQVSQLVIDVGGFLGIGEKPVAMDLGSVDILRQDGGEEIRVYVSQTEEELEAMPGYEGQE